MHPDRVARLHSAVDRQTAERVDIVPWASGDYVAGAADASRPPQTVAAGVTELARTVRAAGSGANSGHNADLRSGAYTIKFTTSSLPYRLQEGDRAILVERGVTMKIAFADPFGTDRTIAHLEPLPASAYLAPLPAS